MSDGNDLEQRIEAMVHELLYDVLVFGYDHSFGLQWRTGTTEYSEDCTGGWLNSIHKGSRQLYFFIVDDDHEELRRQKSDVMAVKTQRIEFSSIKYVLLHVSKKTGKVNVVIETEKLSWCVIPVQEDDYEVIASWVACIRHRTQLFSDDLLAAHQKALKAAIFVQSNYRRKKAREKFLRRRKRRHGLTNILASTVNAWVYGGDGYFDTDSEDEDDEDDNKRRVQKKTETKASEEGIFKSMVATVMSDLYSQAFGAKDVKKVPKIGTVNDDSTLKSIASMTSVGSHETIRLKNSKLYSHKLSKVGRVQQKYLNRPLDPDEVEDEVWESQRWELKSKAWKRMHFSDRLFINKAKVKEGVFSYDTKEWIITKELAIDLSGLGNNTCGNNGWVYASSLRKLMLQQALGKTHISASTSSLVRMRRWFQRRKRVVPLELGQNRVVWHGYMALKTEFGRWQPYYFALTSGLVRQGKMTGITLIQFKHRVKHFGEVVTAKGMHVWDSLRVGKDIKVYQLEGARVSRGRKPKKLGVNDEEVEEHKTARYSLNLRLVGFKNVTMLVACESRQAREEWYAWLSFLIKQQNRNFTLTKIQLDNNKLLKSETFGDIPMYKWSVLTRLLACDVDTFVHLAFFDQQFQERLYERLHAKNVVEVHPWTMGMKDSSRREVRYTLPKQKNRDGKIIATLPKTSVTHKFMVKRYEPGNGMHISSSLELHDVPFGQVMRCLVRTVVAKWKDEHSRIFVSMEIESKSQDEAIKDYFESLMRVFMLNYYREIWIPLCADAIWFLLEQRKDT